MIVTRFPSLEGTRGRRVELAFSDLVDELVQHATRPHDGTGWSPVAFKDDKRAKARVEAAYLLGLDLDGGDLSREDLLAFFAGRAGVVHSTKSYTLAAPRWRVLLVLDRPVTCEEYTAIWNHYARELADAGVAGLDVGTKDASRFWYWPSKPGSGEGVVMVLDGDPVDVDALLEEAAKAAPPEPPPSYTSDRKRVGDRYAEAALDRACEALRAAPKGERNTTLAREAYTIGQLVGAGLISEHVALTELEHAIAGWDPRAARLHKRTLERQLREGKKKPRAPEPRPAPRHTNGTSSNSSSYEADERGAIADDPPPDAPPPPEPDRPWRADLLLNEEGNPRRALANVVTMLSASPVWKDVLHFNSFAQRIDTTRAVEWNDGAPSSGGSWEDSDATRLVAYVERVLGFSMPAGQVYAAVDLVARRTTVNPLVVWLESLKWDAVSRVETWLTTYLGAEDSPYTRDVARWFLVSAVARAFRPGCKVDTMPVFEGPQGAKKSSALRALFGERYFSDTPLDLQSKDRFVGLQGSWLHEMAEMDGFDRAEANRNKSFLSSATDNYRPPYARTNVKVLRTCIFAATTNTDDWQKDVTGGRRFWPVKVGTIDLAALERDRELLWAEAVALYQSGAKWWPETTDEHERATEEQRDRVAIDPWHETIASFVGPRLEISLDDVLSHVLGGSQKGRWDQASQNRVARTLRLLGFVRARRRIEGSLAWVYKKTCS